MLEKKSSKELDAILEVVEKASVKIPSLKGEVAKLKSLKKKLASVKESTSPSPKNAARSWSPLPAEVDKDLKSKGSFGQIKALSTQGRDYFPKESQATRDFLGNWFGEIGTGIHSAITIARRSKQAKEAREFKNKRVGTLVKARAAKKAKRESLGAATPNQVQRAESSTVGSSLIDEAFSSTKQPSIISSSNASSTNYPSKGASGGGGNLDSDLLYRIFNLHLKYYKRFDSKLQAILDAKSGGGGVTDLVKGGMFVAMWEAFKKGMKGAGGITRATGKALPYLGIAAGVGATADSYRRVGSDKAQRGSFLGMGKGESFKNSRGAAYLESAAGGALAGANTGGLLGGPYGAAIGAAIGGVTSMIITAFNDAKLKKSIADFFDRLKTSFSKVWEGVKSAGKIGGKAFRDVLQSAVAKEKNVRGKVGKAVSIGAGKVRDFGEAKYKHGAEVAKYLAAKTGLSTKQAAGFAGNLMHESAGMQTSINEVKPVVKGSRGGFGMAQWTGPRRKQLESWAKKNKRNLNDWKTQADFVALELNTTEKGSRKKIAGASSTLEASKVASASFFRPGEARQEDRDYQALKIQEQIDKEAGKPTIAPPEPQVATTMVPATTNAQLDFPSNLKEDLSKAKSIADIRQAQHRALMAKMESSVSTQNNLLKNSPKTDQAPTSVSVSRGGGGKSLSDDISSVLLKDGMFLNLI